MQQKASRKSFRLEELAALTGAQLYGDPAYRIEDVAELEKAGSRDISFCANSKYLPLLLQTNAGALFVHPSVARDPLKNYLVTDDPSLAFQKALKLFREDLSTITGFTGIHPTAVIHPSAQIGKNVRIAPHVVIDAEAIVGDECWINAGCYIGYKVSIGKECHFHAHVTIREGCVIGDRVILQPGVVIGSCGFGYHTDAKGKHTKLEQTGIVIIEDDVEIGANTTIDRARFDATRIGRGSKIDNLVQIGHNATLGEDNLIVAQTAIAGSAKTGRNVIIAGQSALTGHISVADFTILTARSAFSKSVTKPGGKFGGVPAIPLNEHMRQLAHLRQLGKLIKRIEALEQQHGRSSE